MAELLPFQIAFANDALQRGWLESIRLSEVFPYPEYVVLVMHNEHEIIGARIYMDAPAKMVWVQPPAGEDQGHKVEISAFEVDRKKHIPDHGLLIVFTVDAAKMVVEEYSVQFFEI